jgi:TolB-like protein/tetratricopeptide (TPR) repeat protein
LQYWFEDFVLDCDRRELRRGAVLLPIEAQVFDLLVFLVTNHHRVVSKDDVLASVWGGRIISESTLFSRINAARRAVGDSGDQQRLIRTITGKGVRFVGAVHEQHAPGSLAEGPTGTAVTEPPIALCEKPSIAVLPFANLSGEAEQEYFTDGLVEEVLTALNRIRWLFVIARNSSFRYKRRAVDVKRNGRELGAHYVLEGSVRKFGNRVRITAQLIDTTKGVYLCADRFDGRLEDVFELQDNVAARIAEVVEPALQAAEAARSPDRPTTDVGADDCYVRALTVIHPMTKEAIFGALRLLEQAIAIDQRYGPALSLAASCHMQLVNYGLVDLETSRRKAVNLARRALQVTCDDLDVIASAAMVLAVFGENITTMTALVDDALARNPSSASGWYHSGFLRLMAGKADLAIEQAEVSLGLSLGARTGSAHTLIGASHFVSRHFDEAMAELLLALEQTPNFTVPYRYLAACYAHLEHLEEARDVVKRLRAITPAVMPPDIMYLRNAEHRALYSSGLRLAVGETA